MADWAKIRRENIRWQILLTLNNARPYGVFERIILAVIQAEYPDATQQEIRRELCYLGDRDLVEIDRQPDGRWHGELMRFGVDIVEYTVNCEPGIARPEKYDNA